MKIALSYDFDYPIAILPSYLLAIFIYTTTLVLNLFQPI